MPLLRRKKTAKQKALEKKLAARRAAARKAAAKRAAAKKAAAKKAAAQQAALAKAAAAEQAAAPAVPALPVSAAPTTPAPVTVAPQPLPAPPPATVPPAPDPGPPSPTPVQGAFGPAQAERLLWRAGFGPKPGQVAALAAMGLDAAVDALVHPSGAATLVGDAPHDDNGDPLAPADLWGHDVLWWLDRMVRSDQPLVERMTLVWHDWFATSKDKVGSAALMLAQNEMFRRNALGSFGDLLRDVTHDHAMLVFLDGVSNNRWSPNENYAREVMELFTLGADRGAYTEDDVRELARAFTGYTCDWVDGVGYTNFRIVPSYQDTGSKTVFGHTGAWGIDDGWRLCLEHPLHASYFVTKLWSAFIPTAPGDATVAALASAYVASGHQIAPVLTAILKHPDLYTGPSMVKSPVLFAAGLLRQTGRYVDTDAWSWLLPLAGQTPFFPPNVAGWDEARWLDTGTWRGRWYIATWVLAGREFDPWSSTSPYSTTETATAAVSRALAFFGNPTLGADTLAAIGTYAATCLPAVLAPWQQGPFRAERENALRMLIATCADHQTS